MIFKNLIVTSLTLLMLGPVVNLYASDETIKAQSSSDNTREAEKFVEDVGNQIIKVLADSNHTLDQRKEKFHEILKNYFNIKAIGKFVLGKYWSQIKNDTEQQNLYYKLFEDTTVQDYSEQFDHYANEQLQVLSSQITNSGSILIKTKIIRPQGGEPLNVDWQIFQVKTGMKVHDIIVNGVSMSVTKRNQYYGIIQRENQGVRGLLNVMQNTASASMTKMETR